MLEEGLSSATQELSENIARAKACLHLPEKKEEITALKTEMENPKFWDDQERARKVGQQLSGLEKQVEKWEYLETTIEALQEMAEMASEAEEAELMEEYNTLEKEYKEAELDLYFGGEFDEADALLEINAGAGGTEAQDWAGMLMRMYLRFSERRGFGVEILRKTDGEEAGIKSATFEIKGPRAFGLLKSEKGTHRLVRQSPFNAKNLRQTSFAGVVVTPIIEDDGGEIQIEDKDLRIDTFRSSGAGGQHVNKTDSAIRIVHLPTNIVVECQNGRSQHQNRDTAMKLLKAKLLLKKREEEEQRAAEIRGEVTEAAWGTQIRNYVLHPYKMVKDTRTSVETSQTDAVLDGDLDMFIQAYLEWSAKQR